MKQKLQDGTRTRRFFVQFNKIFKTRNANLIVGCILVLILLFIAVFAGKLAPYNYNTAILTDKLQPPGPEHLFGTDAYGRDVFSRILYGSQIAFKIAIVSVLIQVVVGVTVGMAAGYYGGVVDKVLTFIMDVTWSIPSLIAAFAVITVIGKSLDNSIIAIAFICWPQYARVVRTKTMEIKNMAFIRTGISYGESDFSLMFRYILPNVVPSLVVVASMSIPNAIISTTSLSFLGLGAQPPSPDWGLALSESMAKMTSAPWLGIYPGLALVYTTYAFTVLGEGIRDVLDPHMNMH